MPSLQTYTREFARSTRLKCIRCVDITKIIIIENNYTNNFQCPGTVRLHYYSSTRVRMSYAVPIVKY